MIACVQANASTTGARLPDQGCSRSATATATLSEEALLARGLGRLLTRLLQEGQSQLLAYADRLELSLTQIKCLGVLAASTTEPSLKEVSERLGLSLAATSRAADGLVRRGLVEREEDPGDRRARRLRLSSAGARAWQEFCGLRQASLERYVRELRPPEREALREALVALGLIGKEEE